MSRPLLPPAPPAPQAIQWLGSAVDWTLVVIGAVMVIMVFANVMMHVFHRDIAWTTEFCEFLMVWATFLGGASVARRGTHMVITEFIDKLSAARHGAAQTGSSRSSVWRSSSCWSSMALAL